MGLLSVGLLLAGLHPVMSGAQEPDTTGEDPGLESTPEAVADPAPEATPGPRGPGAAAKRKLPRVAIAVSVDGEDGRKIGLGNIIIELHPEDAPRHVANFLKLVDEGFYNGTTFHRIVPAFVVQCGDQISKRNWQSSLLGTGRDGPFNTIPEEIGRKHLRGAVAAARKQDAVNPGRESSPTQFYICLADLPALDKDGYTVFGEVVEGMDVVDKISRVKNAGPGNRNQALQKVEMTSVRKLD
jgi:peptidyl-prolyl cis-trans isomerase B (cyclophilin B)